MRAVTSRSRVWLDFGEGRRVGNTAMNHMAGRVLPSGLTAPVTLVIE